MVNSIVKKNQIIINDIIYSQIREADNYKAENLKVGIVNNNSNTNIINSSLSNILIKALTYSNGKSIFYNNNFTVQPSQTKFQIQHITYDCGNIFLYPSGNVIDGPSGFIRSYGEYLWNSDFPASKLYQTGFQTNNGIFYSLLVNNGKRIFWSKTEDGYLYGNVVINQSNYQKIKLPNNLGNFNITIKYYPKEYITIKEQKQKKIQQYILKNKYFGNITINLDNIFKKLYIQFCSKIDISKKSQILEQQEKYVNLNFIQNVSIKSTNSFTYQISNINFANLYLYQNEDVKYSIILSNIYINILPSENNFDKNSNSIYCISINDSINNKLNEYKLNKLQYSKIKNYINIFDSDEQKNQWTNKNLIINHYHNTFQKYYDHILTDSQSYRSYLPIGSIFYWPISWISNLAQDQYGNEMVGSVIDFIHNPLQNLVTSTTNKNEFNFLLCNGSDCSNSLYNKLTSNSTTPNLRSSTSVSNDKYIHFSLNNDNSTSNTIYIDNKNYHFLNEDDFIYFSPNIIKFLPTSLCAPSENKNDKKRTVIYQSVNDRFIVFSYGTSKKYAYLKYSLSIINVLPEKYNSATFNMRVNYYTGDNVKYVETIVIPISYIRKNGVLNQDTGIIELSDLTVPPSIPEIVDGKDYQWIKYNKIEADLLWFEYDGIKVNMFVSNQNEVKQIVQQHYRYGFQAVEKILSNSPRYNYGVFRTLAPYIKVNNNKETINSTFPSKQHVVKLDARVWKVRKTLTDSTTYEANLISKMNYTKVREDTYLKHAYLPDKIDQWYNNNIQSIYTYCKKSDLTVIQSNVTLQTETPPKQKRQKQIAKRSCTVSICSSSLFPNYNLIYGNSQQLDQLLDYIFDIPTFHYEASKLNYFRSSESITPYYQTTASYQFSNKNIKKENNSYIIYDNNTNLKLMCARILLQRFASFIQQTPVQPPQGWPSMMSSTTSGQGCLNYYLTDEGICGIPYFYRDHNVDDLQNLLINGNTVNNNVITYFMGMSDYPIINLNKLSETISSFTSNTVFNFTKFTMANYMKGKTSTKPINQWTRSQAMGWPWSGSLPLADVSKKISQNDIYRQQICDAVCLYIRGMFSYLDKNECLVVSAGLSADNWLINTLTYNCNIVSPFKKKLNNKKSKFYNSRRIVHGSVKMPNEPLFDPDEGFLYGYYYAEPQPQPTPQINSNNVLLSNNNFLQIQQIDSETNQIDNILNIPILLAGTNAQEQQQEEQQTSGTVSAVMRTQCITQFNYINDGTFSQFIDQFNSLIIQYKFYGTPITAEKYIPNFNMPITVFVKYLAKALQNLQNTPNENFTTKYLSCTYEPIDRNAFCCIKKASQKLYLGMLSTYLDQIDPPKSYQYISLQD